MLYWPFKRAAWSVSRGVFAQVRRDVAAFPILAPMPSSSTQTVQTVPNWNALDRKILEGGYELEQCLHPTEVAARFKVRILGDRFTEAIADVFAPGALPRGQLSLWVEAGALHHPNLNRPLSVGELAAEGGLWPYFVRLRPDETLGTVLAERALTLDETREVARSVAAALEFLHANGYVHGGVSPEHIFALGNAIQLSMLTLHRTNVPLGPTRAGARFRAPENLNENYTPAADVYCLGCALFEMLTGKKVTPETPADPVELPQPFAYIVDRCLEPNPEKRLSLPSIQALLEGRQIAQPVASPEPDAPENGVEKARAVDNSSPSPVTVAPNSSDAASVVSAVRAEAQTQAQAPKTTESPLAQPEKKVIKGPEVVAIRQEKPVVSAAADRVSTPPLEPPSIRRPPNEPVSPTFSADERIRARRQVTNSLKSGPVPAVPPPTEEEARGSKAWRWLILAAVFLFGILWFARPKTDHRTQPTVAPVNGGAGTDAQTPVGGAPRAVGPAGHTSSTPGAGANSATPEPSAPAAQATVAIAAADRPWRVVVWTFNREADAQRRADAVKQQHPDLNAEVVSAHGHGGPYLVTLGGQMTRTEADRMRQKARAEGLPRDSYVQKLGH